MKSKFNTIIRDSYHAYGWVKLGSCTCDGELTTNPHDEHHYGELQCSECHKLQEGWDIIAI